MITIFEKNTTSFKGLGLGALLPSSCTITEELNGGFELKMNHPYDPYGKWERIQIDRILYAPTPRGLEPFRIYKVKPTMDGITVNARHIFYDLQDNLCMLVEYTGKAKGAMSHLVSRFSYAMPFSFATDLTTNGTLYGEFINPIQALLSESDDIDSFVKVYGGELLRQGFSVSMLNSIGEDRGATIRYGKNLLGLEVDEDISELKTRIIIRNEVGTEIIKDSPYINEYLYPKLYIIDGGDAAINEMESMAAALFAEGIDRPKLNIRVDFQTLSKTEEYKGYAILEEVQLGDTVTVIHEKMKFSQTRKVIAYEWDAVLEKYVSVELGDTLPSLSATTNRLRQLIKSQQGKTTEIEISIDGIRTRVSDAEGNISTLEQTADQIQTEVTNAKGDISLIQQRADALAMRVTNAEGDIAAMEVTADHILTRVSDAEDNISSVEQTAEKIEWVVASGTNASNFTLTSRMANLVAAEIDVTGFVTFKALAEEGETTINGSNITTGEILAEYIALGGEMVVYEEKDNTQDIGGYIGYGRGNDGSSTTYGILMKDNTETSYFIATDSGARMTYDNEYAVFCNQNGVTLMGDYEFRAATNFVCRDSGACLGSSSYPWDTVYAETSEIDTSDERKKNSISYDLTAYEALFERLKPTQYKLNSGKSGRLHIGFIAQDVEKAMQEIGMDSKDFAGFIKSPVYKKQKKNGEPDTESEIIDYNYGLRYGEFIAILVYMTQKLMKRVEELEKKLEGGDTSEN